MVLSVFGDESADESAQRVFAVAGLFGIEDEWKQAEDAWTALTKGEVFHAAEWERDLRHDEYKALAQALAASMVGGVSYAMDLVEFSRVYPDTAPQAPYLKCFSSVVTGIAKNAHAFNARETEPFTRIEYTFDNRPEIQFSAARLYGTFIDEPEWPAAPLLASKLSFECRTNPRIQMADMVAREAMKDLDRLVGPVKFNERKSKVALKRNMIFVALRREDYEAEKVRNAALEKDGFSQEAYHEWLKQKGAQDTWVNKARFVRYFDAKRGEK
jgi:hypothetical protein